jgi:antitoxin YefM
MDIKISSIQPATEIRKKLFDVLFSLEGNLEEAIVVTLKNKPKAVILSYELFDSLMETLDVLSDKELMKDIDKALKSKDYIPLKEVLNENGFAISDVKKKYDVSAKHRATNKKKPKKSKPKI